MHAANGITGRDLSGRHQVPRSFRSSVCFVGTGALSLLGTCRRNPLSFKLLVERLDYRLSVFMVASCMFACHRFEYVYP